MAYSSSWTPGQRGLAAVCLFGAALAAWWPTLTALVSTPPARVATFDEDFNAGVMSAYARQEGFTACPNGWCLAPNESGTLIYTLPAAASEWLGIAIWLNQPEDGTSEMVLVSTRGRQSIVLNETLSGERRYLRVPGGGGALTFRIHIRNGPTRQVLALDKLTFDFLSGPPRRPASSLATFLAVFSLCLGLAAGGRRPLFGAAASAIVAFGAVPRIIELSRVADFGLDPDAALYLEYAKQMDLFSGTGFYSGLWGQREPLFILAVRTFILPFGGSEFHLRLFTTLLSIGSVGVVIWASSRLLGRGAGLFTGALIAAAQPFHREAARGLRLELEIILFMTYLVLAFGSRPIRHAWHSTRLGVLGGLLSLLRSTYLPVTLAVSAFSLVRIWPRARQIGLGLVIVGAVTLTLVAPHRYGLYRVHGNPFHDTTLYARWNANFEFAGRPGFPTLADLQGNGYLGPPISYWHYMFEMHSPWDLAVGTVRGYVKMFLRMDLRGGFPNIWNIVFQACAGAGFLLSLRGGRAWLPFTFVLVSLPTAFLYDRGLVELHRHTFVAFPLAALGAYVSLEHVFRYRWRRETGG